MLVTILSIIGVLCLLTWGAIAYLGRSQSLTVKSIENTSGNSYLIRLEKPKNMTWKAGSYAKFTLADAVVSGQETIDAVSGATKSNGKSLKNNHWLTIASNPDENEILILTHNSSSHYKKRLTSLPAGGKVKINWLESSLTVADDVSPLVCFASDVGIAAMRPIVKEWAGKREIVLIHLDKDVTVFDEELSQLSSRKENFVYETTSDLNQSKERTEEALNQYGNQASYLLAGQPDDVASMKSFLEDKGISAGNIKAERFKGLE